MMDDTNHTEEQLLRELEAQRQRIAELEIRCDKQEMRCCGILASIDSGVGVYEVVDGGKDVLFKDINAAGERIGQVRKEDIVGRSLLAIFPTAGEDGTFDVICDVWKTGQPRTMPAHLYDDGRIVVWTEDHLFKLPSNEIVHVANDVTRSMMAQQALEESEEKYRALVEGASEAISVFDGNGILKFANAKVCEHFESHLDDLLGQTMWELFPEPAADRQMRPIQKVIETGAGLTVEIPSVIQGQDKWFEATLVPIRSGRGKALDVMVIARDVTELRNARDELGAFHQQMMQTERLASTGTLSAMVAHELNQPLTVIKLSVQNVLSALNANQPSETLFEDLNECLKGVENAAERVGQFRSFARGMLRREKSLVAVRPVIDKTLRLVEEGCERARLAITVDGFEDLPPVRACAQDLEQLFFILVENSFQASDRKRDHHLTITGASRAHCIEVRLADDCGGIAPDNVNEIFKLFFTTKSRSQGTGLGLCIAERIVTEMGGKITVHNDPGQGVAFWISLPVPADP